MKFLGNTYGAVLSDPVFNYYSIDKLKEYWMSAFDIEDTDALLNSATDSGIYATGKYYLLEDEDDINQMMLDTGCSDITQECDKGDMLFDMAMYLDATETLAQLITCTSDSGGDIYIVPSELFEEFPTIREHIFEANQ